MSGLGPSPLSDISDFCLELVFTASVSVTPGNSCRMTRRPIFVVRIDQYYAQGIHHHHLLNVASLLLSIDSMFEKANLHISIIIQLVPGVNGLLTNAIGM